MHICIIPCMQDGLDFNAQALLAAKRAKELGLTQAQIASALSASQSQVSRVLSGNSRRHSKLLDGVCKYVFSVSRGEAQEPRRNADLMAALSAVWDGTDEHARALALVIRSLGALHPGSRARHAPGNDTRKAA